MNDELVHSVINMAGRVLCLFVCMCASVVASPTFISKGLPEAENPDYPFLFYSKETWGASPAKFAKPLKTPVPYVVIHHTYMPAACYDVETCMKAMRSMQDYHDSLGWGDIGYNFCVGSEGGAYEGRGWNTIGIHAGPANNYSIGICLIGDWRVKIPPEEQLETVKALISVGVYLGKISHDYKLIGHSQVMATECPGRALLQEISTWDHYVPGRPDFKKYKTQDAGNKKRSGED